MKNHMEGEAGAVYYEDSELSELFEERKVPEREFMNRLFFGGRLGIE